MSGDNPHTEHPRPDDPAAAPLRFTTLWHKTEISEQDELRRRLYRRVFETPDGRQVLADLMLASGYVTARPPSDAASMAYGEGARWTVQYLLSLIAADPARVARAVAYDDVNEVFHV
jgi:hypothetical protein